DCPNILSNPDIFDLVPFLYLRKQKNQYDEIVDSCRYIDGSSCKYRYNHFSNSNIWTSVLLFIWEEPNLNSSSFTRLSIKLVKANTKVSLMSERIEIYSVSHPWMNNNRAIILFPMAKAIFALMMFNVLRLSLMVKGSFLSSSPIKATSAVSRAVSVPAPPIAIPTVEAASAGASLTPSPTMPT